MFLQWTCRHDGYQNNTHVISMFWKCYEDKMWHFSLTMHSRHLANSLMCCAQLQDGWVGTNQAVNTGNNTERSHHFPCRSLLHSCACYHNISAVIWTSCFAFFLKVSTLQHNLDSALLVDEESNSQESDLFTCACITLVMCIYILYFACVFVCEWM